MPAGIIGPTALRLAAPRAFLTENPLMSKVVFLCLSLVAISPLFSQAPVSVTLTADKDNTLYDAPSGLISNGFGTGIFVGMDSGSMIRRRALVSFNVAGTVPAGATILSAELRLVVAQTTAPAQVITVRRVTQLWGEANSVPFGGGGGGAVALPGDATWSHAILPTNLWNQPGGDFVPYGNTSILVGGTGPYVWPSNSEMIADVQQWLDSPSNNFGWLLHDEEVPMTQSAKRFDSRHVSNAANRPKLILTYVTGTGPSATVSGNGCPGSGGGMFDPDFRLRTNEPPRLGSATFQIQAVNGLAGGSISLYLASAISGAPLPLPGANGCAIFLDVPSAQLLINSGLSPIGPIPTASGSLNLPIPLPLDPGLANVSLSVQAASFDGISFLASNAITLNFQF